MNRFIRVIERISQHTGQYIAYLLVPLVVTIVYSVVMRYYFNEIVDWAFEMSLFMYGMFVMVGGAYALKTQAHVRVDILPERVSRRAKCWLDLFSFVVIIAVCFVLVYIGSKMAWESTLRLERSPRQTLFNPPIWWYRWLIPFSAAILGLQAIAESAKIIRKLSNNDPGRIQ